MKPFKRERVFTNDGSPSLFLPEHQEHYHSVHGAVQESKHVFIRMGFEKILETRSGSQDPVAILEFGFGTGLNAFLTAKECAEKGVDAFYYSAEAFPLEKEEWSAISYAANEDDQKLFAVLHEAKWNEDVRINDHFVLHKAKGLTEELSIPEDSFDLVYYDAFSPRVQPELWTEEIFKKMFACMRKGGILVTYCAKGQVRRNMKAAGFEVERAPGPPGKREMLRAWCGVRC